MADRPGACSTRTDEAVIASMMAGHAIQWGLHPLLRVLLAVAVHAPAHGEGADDGARADEIDQVVGDEVAQAVGAHAGHALDGAVAGLALDAGADVGLVGEVRELRHLEDADPRNRL